MNITYFAKQSFSAGFFAVLTIVSLLLSAFPASFFVAYADVSLTTANLSESIVESGDIVTVDIEAEKTGSQCENNWKFTRVTVNGQEFESTLDSVTGSGSGFIDSVDIVAPASPGDYDVLIELFQGDEEPSLSCPETVWDSETLQLSVIEKTETTIVVTGDTSAGENQLGWLFNRDKATQTPFEFNTDEKVIGDGALYVLPIINDYDGSFTPPGCTAGVGCDKFIGEYFWQGLMAELDAFSYDFKIGAGGAASDENEFYLNVYANFGGTAVTNFYDCKYDVVPTIGSTGSFTTVTFNPTSTYSVTTRGSSPHTCPTSPADMDTLSTGSTIRAFSINTGDTSLNDEDLDGYFDNVVLETNTEVTTFDFEPISDNVPPEATIKDDAITCEGGFVTLSYKLHDEGLIDKVVINGLEKDLSDDEWSDVNGLAPGVFGAVAGDNTMIVYDVAGNTSEYHFYLCEKDEEPQRCENLLENGSFEEPEVIDASLWQKMASVAGWVIEKVSDSSATTLELHRGWSGNEAAHADQYAELDGDEPTRISQTVTTIPGGIYELKWAFAPRQSTSAAENELSVEVDGFEVATNGPIAGIGVLSQDDWGYDSYQFEADGASTEIAFKDLGPEAVGDEADVGTFLDDAQLCLVSEPEPEITIHTTKIVCTDEAELPNYGIGGPNMTETTATDWVAQHDSCEIVDGWEFEWGDKNISDPGDTLVGPAGGDWTTFTGSVTIPFSTIEGDSHLWMREVLQSDYIPFTHGPEGNKNTDDYTAEMYCHTDVLNYDNYDRVDNPQADGEYYCVAWNVANQMCSLEAVSDTGTVIVENDEYAVDTWEHNAWTANIPGADWIWEAYKVLNPTQAETKTFKETFTAEGIKNAFLDVAADNTYKVTINGNLVANVTDDNNFSSISQDNYDVTSYIMDGENTLEIEVTNKAVANSSPESNPAGVLYKLIVNAETECELTTYIELEPEYGPYCGDGIDNQEWEQCDGGAECTDYCTLANQCSSLPLVKVTLGDTVLDQSSFDSTLHLGAAGNTIPNGTWVHFDEPGDASFVTIANAVEGLAIQRDTVNNKLALAFVGGNASKHNDVVAGTIDTLGITLGNVDRSPNPQFKLENGSGNSFDDVFDITGNSIVFDLRADTGNDGVTVVVGEGEEYDCPDCAAEVEARVVLQGGEQIFNNGNGNLNPVVILGDGTEVPFGEWFKVSEATSSLSANWINDPKTVTNYDNPKDKAGLFVSREGNGEVKVALYGFHNPGGDTNYESLRATIEFNDASVSDVNEIPGNFQLENHSEADNVSSNDNFDSFNQNATTVDFDFWVDTKADGITITLGDVDFCDEDDDPVDPDPETYMIDGYKYEVTGNSSSTLSGWNISAYNTGNATTLATTTDENGYYYFVVEEGDWEVTEEVQLFWNQVLVEENYVEADHQGDGVEYCDFEVDEDAQYRCDFYNEYEEPQDPTYMVEGVKYQVFDTAPTTTYAGWTIYASNGETTVSTTTDSNGAYKFTLPAGDWEIYETLPTDWEQVAVWQNGSQLIGDGTLSCEFEFGSPNFSLALFVSEEDDENSCDFYNQYNEPVITTSSGGGNGGSTSGTRITERVTRTPLVAGASTDFCPFITDYMQIGTANDTWEVTKLQLFLNLFVGPTPITGIFDTTTDANVKLFQEEHRDEILTPWFNRGIVPHDQPTGFVYKLTRWKINSLVCPGEETYPSFEGEDLSSNVDID